MLTPRTLAMQLFGTSNQLAVGPVAIMSLLSEEGVAHIVEQETGGHGNPARFMELVSAAYTRAGQSTHSRGRGDRCLAQ